MLAVPLTTASAHELAAAACLPITAPLDDIPRIVDDLNRALIQFSSAPRADENGPSLRTTIERAEKLADAAAVVIGLLDGDNRGPDGSLAPHTPVPGFLTAHPAYGVPGIDVEIAFDKSERRGDEARDAMMAEAGIAFTQPTIYGAHDVTRVAVAALRQCVTLAEAAARNASVIRESPLDLSYIYLFRALCKAFKSLHPPRRFTISTKTPRAGSFDQSAPSGPAFRWTCKLFDLASDSEYDLNTSQVIRKARDYYSSHPSALAARIRQAGRYAKAEALIKAAAIARAREYEMDEEAKEAASKGDTEAEATAKTKKAVAEAEADAAFLAAAALVPKWRMHLYRRATTSE